jgi:hypothetical protein
MLIGQSHVLIGRSHVLIGRSRTLIGHSRTLIGHSRMLVAHSRMLVAHSRAPRHLFSNRAINAAFTTTYMFLAYSRPNPVNPRSGQLTS